MRWSRSKVIKAAQVSANDYFVPVFTRETRADGAAVATDVVTHAERAALESVQQQERERETAFEAGRVAGKLEAEDSFREALRVLTQSVSRIDHDLAQFLERVEGRVAVLALAIVRKIVGQVSDDRAELIRQSIRKVLARHREPGDMLTIRLNPEDHLLLAPAVDVAPKNLKFVADAGIERGGCVLETKFGTINAQVNAQLEEIERELLLRNEDVQQEGSAEVVVRETSEVRGEGHVVNMVGMVIESRGPSVTVGEHCEVLNADRSISTPAEVIGFRKNRVLLMPLAECHGVGPGHLVVARGTHFTAKVGPQLLGRVLNGLGQPIDGLGPLTGDERVSIHAQPNNPMERRAINEPLYTGVRAIDGLITCGKGVRMGIFAGSGVGKSVLLGMMARNTQADVNVIALIGERGREVKEFVERDLGPEGLSRSVIVAVTSDESPVVRIHGAKLAATLAEYFAKQGKDVMFMMDSVTRFAMAYREVGLAAGEPPATKGYTPSTFAALPKLLERSGIFGERGSITGFYTVLVEGDDMDEPVADHVRSILDGHVVLSRSLASQNHFPAIDVLGSVSRLMRQVCTPEQVKLGGQIRDTMATMADAQDLVNIGAYAKGSNPKIDKALLCIEDIRTFLRQKVDEKVSPEEMWAQMSRILQGAA